MEQQGYPIALGIGIDDSETALHEVLDRFHHHVAETHIIRSFELADLLGEAAEAATINTGYHVNTRQHTLIGIGLINPHGLV